MSNETVHRTRHVNIRKYHPDVAAALEYLYCFLGVGGLNDLEACIFSNIDLRTIYRSMRC